MVQLSSLSQAPAGSSTVLICDDARADGGTRRVTVSSARIEIERRRDGIAMRLALPVEAYQGVAMALRVGAAGRTFYELRLAHRDPDLSVVLAEALDDRDIWAQWRAWAAELGLPALVERSQGLEVHRDAAWRPSAAAPVMPRRRARRRRAPFVRRHQSQAPAPAVIHRGAEIIARS